MHEKNNKCCLKSNNDISAVAIEYIASIYILKM